MSDKEPEIIDAEAWFDYGLDKGKIIAYDVAKEIIRSHMNHSGDDAEMGDWISVEERLPEEDDVKRYIVTDEHGLVRSEMEYGHPMDGNREVCFHKWDDECWSCYRPKVIAWQPLPEPYKPKQD